MKTKTTVFYDDNDVQSFNSVKNYLFETFAEEEGWISEDEIPDCVVYHEKMYMFQPYFTHIERESLYLLQMLMNVLKRDSAQTRITNR